MKTNLFYVGFKPTYISKVNSCCATTYTKTQNHYIKSITGLKKTVVKIKNRDHKKIPKQDEHIGYLQILLQLRSLF